jgi:hypothetical protein
MKRSAEIHSGNTIHLSHNFFYRHSANSLNHYQHIGNETCLTFNIPKLHFCWNTLSYGTGHKFAYSYLRSHYNKDQDFLFVYTHIYNHIIVSIKTFRTRRWKQNIPLLTLAFLPSKLFISPSLTNNKVRNTEFEAFCIDFPGILHSKFWQGYMKF